MPYPLAVQLYTLRNLSSDMRDLLKVVADTGYQGVEGGYGPELDAPSLRAALSEYGLSMVSSHVLLDVLEAQFDAIVDDQRALGNSVLVISWLDAKDYGASAESWQRLGARINELAERVNAEEMTLLYHNHAFEFARYEGKLGLEHLLDSAPALGLELDIGWCQEGGVDPLGLIERYRGRLKRVHVKDRAPDGENQEQDGWADVGYGVIDWPPLLAAAQAAGTEWFIVEHDEPADPVQTITRSLDYLRGLS